MAGDKEQTRDEIRQALIAKIGAAWPAYIHNRAIARSIELGSNDDLRKHLAWAEIVADISPVEPHEYVEPTLRTPAEERQLSWRVLSQHTGANMPAHTYVLAREECQGFYDGPEWDVPFNLWSHANYGGHDKLVVDCAKKLIYTPGAQDIWELIAKEYERPDNLASILPDRCAEFLAHWSLLPKLKPGEYKDARLTLKRHAQQLAIELERFFFLNGGCNDGPINFTQLLTEAEQDHASKRIRWVNHGTRNRALFDAGVRANEWDPDDYSDEGDVWELLISDDRGTPGIVPNLPDMLRRIAQFFDDESTRAPLARPNNSNAARNYFANRLCRLFRVSFGYAAGRQGNRTPRIIASIVSIFFEQGMTDNEASKVLAAACRAVE